MIIPLIVQPLVENALKHGIQPALLQGRDGLSVSLAVFMEGSALHLVVRNSGMPYEGNSAKGRIGIGIENLRKRLAFAYGDVATFSMSVQNLETVASITIPAEMCPCECES
jgi:LytS/YehU family sensor histidine kinase